LIAFFKEKKSFLLRVRVGQNNNTFALEELFFAMVQNQNALIMDL
jgi:hypothetical protein